MGSHKSKASCSHSLTKQMHVVTGSRIVTGEDSDAHANLYTERRLEIWSQEVAQDACGDAFNARCEQGSLELSTYDQIT